MLQMPAHISGNFEKTYIAISNTCFGSTYRWLGM